MPKGKRGIRKPDALEIRFRLNVPKSEAKTMSAAKFNRIYAHWVETQELPPGYSLAATPEWRNPKRMGARSGWRTGDTSEFISTLARRALPITHFDISRNR